MRIIFVIGTTTAKAKMTLDFIDVADGFCQFIGEVRRWLLFL